MVTNERTSIAVHFDGHAEAMKQYMQHRSMQYVQGYSGTQYCSYISEKKDTSTIEMGVSVVDEEKGTIAVLAKRRVVPSLLVLSTLANPTTDELMPDPHSD